MKRKISPKLSETPKNSTDGKIRLNKYLSNNGISSRREADAHILAGKVKVNGQIITELGHKIDPEDKVTFENQVVTKPKNLVYILLNKPAGVITTTKDPEN